ncbi:MAG: LysM peptidoglycan-binding domain-containing protein [Chloroflexota bacterium]|nr:LysM peptidoglycan-binding domain-containing protein [Chloroflexota bacterium]MYE27309.1 LysM peptidoglycan-binding domain-containing protein [Chloroflexota bacterium]
MKPRLILSLLVSAMLLVGCYRQTEEPFQQVDSAEVVVEATVAVIVADEELSGDEAASETTSNREYITPETMPGQVEQPTIELPTSEATAPAATLEPLARPTQTLSFAEELDPDDECVYEVQAGNVLFRLALAWGTTYQTIMEVNQLDSEDLSIGQLLLIPDCEPEELEEPEASATEAPTTPGAIEIPAEDDATTAPSPVVEPVAPPVPEIHVVSAGETIESISLKYRVDVNELIALNEIADRNRLSVGQELQLPER